MTKVPTQRDLYEMIPATRHGLQALACVSAMQKCIRRGMEREAMEFAVELIHTSKAFCTMVTNRLEIISHEDIDTVSQPWIVPFVRTACQQAREWYDPDKLGKSRMPIGNVIRLMCRAKKSREGDHFQAAIGLASELEGRKPEIQEAVIGSMGTFYRVRLGPYASPEQSQQICGSLRATGFDCLVVPQ